MTKLQAIFFDFDGVLADSVDVKTRAFEKLFKPYGQKIVDRVIEHHFNNGGMTRTDKFKHYYNTFLGKELNEITLKTLCSKFSELVVDDVVASPEIPGASTSISHVKYKEA
jgi:beta-phosphoglucomutase-like phosphatase (HAD superfamily)